MKFTRGTNHVSVGNFNNRSCPLEIRRKPGLMRKDIFVPGRAPNRIQRELVQARGSFR